MPYVKLLSNFDKNYFGTELVNLQVVHKNLIETLINFNIDLEVS